MGKRKGLLISREQRVRIQRLIQEACESGASAQASCEIVGITIRTLQRWNNNSTGIDGRSTVKKNPTNKLTEDERKQVLEVVNSPTYVNLPPSKIVPMLADNGRYIASEATMYKIMKEEKLINHRLSSKPSKHNKPKTFKATAPNKIYSWDITYLKSQINGIYFYLYLFMDVYSRKIVGWQIYDIESSSNAADVLRDISQKEGITPGEVVLHSDNGSPMKGATMLATLQKLGVIPSFSRPSVSDDNPYSEALFKTLKYCPKFPFKPFSGIQEARQWVAEFVNWYNNHHLHSGIKFVTPVSRHNMLDDDILKNRSNVYLEAKHRNPNRWSRNTRNWNPIKEVFLNPERCKV